MTAVCGRAAGRRLGWSLFLGGLLLLLLLPLQEAAAQGRGPAKDQVEKGKHLVMMMGCNDCHTPLKMGPNGPEPDMTRMLSGHPEALSMPPAVLPEMPWGWLGAATNTAFAGPWGTTFAANLTPDDDTGIGHWTEEVFLKTVRTGKLMGTGRPIQPPMPIWALQQATDQELRDMFAFLKSAPPIRNQVPDYVPPSPGGSPGGAPEGGGDH
jgi:mono/diheme cytochrome c family protein